MDDFDFDRPELSGSTITMEFSNSGRISQLWVIDPNQINDETEAQLVMPNLSFGEEVTEDYYPGTILIGARTSDDEPWILSRNAETTVEDDDFDLNQVNFHYHFPLLPEIEANGRFFDRNSPIPHIVWEVSVRNASRTQVEIGELAFTLGFDNILHGFGKSDVGRKRMWYEKFHLHEFIGGAASYLFAQRLNGEPPGLLVCPGEDTGWEFYVHAQTSLVSEYRWQGVPVVFVHSKATIEREEWKPWFNGHSSRILAPGEVTTYRTIFASADRGRQDGLATVLQDLGRPYVKLFPSAVAPADVGISLDVGGTTPVRFESDVPAEVDTDADEHGGYCFVKPNEPGHLQMSITDIKDRVSNVHLLFTEPLETLIKNRADWICRNQVHEEPNSVWRSAIVSTSIHTGAHLTDESEFAVQSSLGEALFLAEKNRVYPVKAEVDVLNKMITDFIRDDLQNPGNGAVGSRILPGAVALAPQVAQNYVHLANLYLTLSRIAEDSGFTEFEPAWYAREAAFTVEAMFKFAMPLRQRREPLLGLDRLASLPKRLEASDMGDLAKEIRARLADRLRHVSRTPWPYDYFSYWSEGMFEEPAFAQQEFGPDELLERTSLAMAAGRSLSPSWWWYGSDKRWLEDAGEIHPALLDKGEECLGPSGPGNAGAFFRDLEGDATSRGDVFARMAFGGLMGVWALVRPDGAAAMGFCPDSASRQFGMNEWTGDIGLGLWNYMCHARSLVLTAGSAAPLALGCHLDAGTEDNAEQVIIKPWDGVGRHIHLPHFGMEATVIGGRITELQMDSRKRNATVTIENASEAERTADLRIRGLWGVKFNVNGETREAEDGQITVSLALSAHQSTKVEIRGTE